MFRRAQPIATGIWRWFRKLPLFIQLLLIFPILCAVGLTLTVGNMGLALMGTAIAIPSIAAGWLGGVFVLVLGKAGIVIAKDRVDRG